MLCRAVLPGESIFVDASHDQFLCLGSLASHKAVVTYMGLSLCQPCPAGHLGSDGHDEVGGGVGVGVGAGTGEKVEGEKHGRDEGPEQGAPP